MISTDTLRERLNQSDAWSTLADVLKFSGSTEALIESISEQGFFDIFTCHALASPELLKKLYRYPLPDFTNQDGLGEASLQSYLVSGLSRAIEISAIASQHGFVFDETAKILDFGCGASRILRFFLEFLPLPQYAGVDTSEQAIAWNQTSFQNVSFICQPDEPPLSFAEQSFNFIYSFSNFTHYREDLQMMWLEELYRLLQPQGLLILCVHGNTLFKRCKNDVIVSLPIKFPTKHYSQIERAYQEDGYFFYSPYDQDALKAKQLNPETFGLSGAENS